MHHSKRWVRTYDGRLKRSSHRTIQDRLGDVVSPGKLWDIEHHCRDCNRQHSLHGYFFTCRRCREREKDCRRVINERDGYKCAPRWYRNMIERQYRRKVYDLMAHERYEALPAKERLHDAAWRWF